MAKQVAISGFDNVLRNLNQKIGMIKSKSRQGLKVAGLIVEGASKRMTPVDTGNLRAGTYTELLEISGNVGVEIGYTANYAVFVHERTELHHNFGQAKFLEEALKQNERQILGAIAGKAKM